MSKGDTFIGEVRKQRFGGAPTQKQLDQEYDDLETRLFEAVADFGVDELNQMLEAAETIRARRPS